MLRIFCVADAAAVMLLLPWRPDDGDSDRLADLAYKNNSTVDCVIRFGLIEKLPHVCGYRLPRGSRIQSLSLSLCLCSIVCGRERGGEDGYGWSGEVQANDINWKP